MEAYKCALTVEWQNNNKNKHETNDEERKQKTNRMMTTAAAEYDDAKHMYAYRYRCTSDRECRVQRVVFFYFSFLRCIVVFGCNSVRVSR